MIPEQVPRRTEVLLPTVIFFFHLYLCPVTACPTSDSCILVLSKETTCTQVLVSGCLFEGTCTQMRKGSKALTLWVSCYIGAPLCPSDVRVIFSVPRLLPMGQGVFT
jgi:hypothetical protein